MSLLKLKDKLMEKRKSKGEEMKQAFSAALQDTIPSDIIKSTKAVKKALTANKFKNREPKRPPKSGKALFTSKQLSTLTNTEPKKRMNELLGQLWNKVLSNDQKELYDAEVKELAHNYDEKLAEFEATLSPEEYKQYQQYKSERNKKGRGKKSRDKRKKSKGNGKNSSKESGSESENQSEKEDQEQPDSSGSGAESVSENDEETEGDEEEE